MMLAAGVKENILFWDLRKTSPGKQQQADAIFSESHNEELTHVHIASLLFFGDAESHPARALFLTPRACCARRSSSTPWRRIGYSPARPMAWSACLTRRNPTKMTPSFPVRCPPHSSRVLHSACSGKPSDGLLAQLSDAVTPTDKAVETLGFFGNNGAFMYVVSSDQTVCLYNIEQVRAPYIAAAKALWPTAQPVNVCAERRDRQA